MYQSCKSRSPIILDWKGKKRALYYTYLPPARLAKQTHKKISTPIFMHSRKTCWKLSACDRTFTTMSFFSQLSSLQNTKAKNDKARTVEPSCLRENSKLLRSALSSPYTHDPSSLETLSVCLCLQRKTSNRLLGVHRMDIHGKLIKQVHSCWQRSSFSKY
jgi:hypothetical protein